MIALSWLMKNMNGVGLLGFVVFCGTGDRTYSLAHLDKCSPTDLCRQLFYFILFYFQLFYFYFETRSHSVVQAGLKFTTIQSAPQSSSVTGMSHCTRRDDSSWV